MVNCSFCERRAIYVNYLNGRAYCKLHFTSYFERKVRRTIRKHRMLGEKEHIVVAVSGGKDSMSLIHILRKLSRKNKNWRLTALLVFTITLYPLVNKKRCHTPVLIFP